MSVVFDSATQQYRAQPLHTLAELLAWREPAAGERVRSHVPLQEHWRGSKSSTTTITSKSKSTTTSSKGRVLVCHDLAGGYSDDAASEHSAPALGCTLAEAWRCADTLVYFAHALLATPPPASIDAAHRHGVRVLGTLLTEWAAGAAICASLLDAGADAQLDTACAQAVRVARFFRFDGYLVNIENAADPHRLLIFLSRLARACRAAGLVVLWYDAVTDQVSLCLPLCVCALPPLNASQQGRLQWQNCLNARNRQYFDVCDGSD